MKAINILLVEDNPTDLLLAREAINRCQNPIELHIAYDGQEALGFLEQHATTETSNSPSMVLLDLKLGGMDSLELLRHIRQNPKLRYLPVIIMSAQADWLEAKRFFAAGANSYLPKPMDLEEFQIIIQGLEMFWLESCVLPAHNYFALDVA